MRDDDSTNKDEEKGASLLTMGATLGIAGISAAAVAGVTCPICVIGAPVLIGAGLWKRYQCTSLRTEASRTEGGECKKE